MPGERDPEERISTREHRLIQRVLKRERRGGLAWKIFGMAGGVIAIISWLSTNGPFSGGWKFQTLEAAAKLERQHAEDVAALHVDDAKLVGAVEQINKSITNLTTSLDERLPQRRAKK